MQGENKKYSFGILLCATRDSAFVIGSLMGNVKQKMQESGCDVDIFYCIHDGFSASDQKALYRVAGDSKICFESFSKEDFLKKLNRFAKTPMDLQNNRFLSRWTHMVYACFEGFRLLQECECLVYLDFDVLLLQEIGHLKHLRKQGYALAANGGKNPLKLSFPCVAQEFANLSIFRTGIIVFNDILENPMECYEFIYRQSAINTLNDQAVFSLLVFEKNIKIKNLDHRYAGSVLWRLNHNPILIHAYGTKNRFWNNRLCNQIWNQWNLYYQRWLQAGGSPNAKGFIANTTYGYERIRYHLSYKLGYAIISHYKSVWGTLKLPFILIFIWLKHKKESRFYARIIQKEPHLKLPPLSTYEDYLSALEEKQTYSYRLGHALIDACKTPHRGGILKFFAVVKSLKTEARLK